MPTDTHTVPALAREARGWFETFTRTGSEEPYWRTKREHPDWITDLCRAAHNAGEMFPDDHRYAFIVEALDYLADQGDPDDYMPEADVYTADLTAWLGSHAFRPEYVDRARADGLLTGSEPIFEALAVGQIEEKREVYAEVLTFLRDRTDADEEEAS